MRMKRFVCGLFFLAASFSLHADCTTRIRTYGDAARFYKEKRHAPTAQFISEWKDPTVSHFNRIGNTAYYIGKHGLRVAMGPTVLPLRVVMETFSLTFKLKNPGLLPKLNEFMVRSLALPVHILKKDGWHIAGYYILGAFGSNMYVSVIDGKDEQSVFGDELLADLPNEPLAKNEKALLIYGAADSNAEDVEATIYKKNPHLKGKLEKVKAMSQAEVDAILKAHEGKKDIKYLFLNGHSADGMMALGAETHQGDYDSSTVINSASLKENKSQYKDVLATGAKVYLAGCEICRAPEGKEFAHDFSSAFGDSIFSLKGPTGILIGRTKEERMKDRFGNMTKVDTFEFEEIVESLVTQTIAPVFALNFALQSPPEDVRVYEVNSSKKTTK